MEREVLLSRLRAACNAAGVLWDASEPPGNLGRRMADSAPNAFVSFLLQFDLAFDAVPARFYHLANSLEYLSWHHDVLLPLAMGERTEVDVWQP